MKNKVSLWIGKLENKEELDKLMIEIYDEEGDSISEFVKGFEIDYIDNQFQEVFYYDSISTKEELFDGFSYLESFYDMIPNDINWSSYNCVILIYNFEYDKKQLSFNDVEFIGTYDFIIDDE